LDRVSRWEWIALVLILLLAVGLRLTRLELIEFKYDEATVARGALAIARGERLPAVGMVSSQGPHNLPLSEYLLALPFRLSHDPRLAAGFLGLLGAVAVGLTWWVGRREFGPLVGLVAAALFAASPWAVSFSRKLWAQNQPVLTLLFVAAMFAWVVRRRPWALVGALAAVGGLIGLHLGGLALVFVLGLVGLFFLRRLRPLPLLVGLAVLLLLVAPYVIYDARHEWGNARAFLDMAQRDATADLDGVRMLSMIVGGWHFWDLAGAQHVAFMDGLPALWALDWLEAAAFWAGTAWLVVWLVRRAARERGRLDGEAAARLVLLCWLATPLLLQVRHSAPLGPHYFILLYPAPHLVIALGVRDLWTALGPRRVGRALAAVGVAALVALLLWQAWVFEAMLTFVDRHDTTGGYGPPLRYAQEAAREAEALAAEEDGAEVIVLLPGADPRYHGDAAAFDVLLGRASRLIDGRAGIVLPAGPVVYLTAPGTEPAESLLTQLADEAAAPLPLRGGSPGRYRFFVRSPAAVAPPYAAAARWASGAQLLGYDVSGEAAPGGLLHWTLYWRVESEPPPGADLHWFNHLLGSDETRWGQMDGVGVSAATWRVGDVAIAWFDIPIGADAPPPPYTVRSGLYTYPELAGVPLVDEAGNPAGDFVELGPLGD
jgi:hypothetical protein